VKHFGKPTQLGTLRLRSTQRGNYHFKHKWVMFVTTHFVSKRRASPIQTFSFPSSSQQLHGLHKTHNWDKLCVEGASSRNWNRRSGCGVARRRARGAYRGGSSNACALDVGALTYSLISFLQSSNQAGRLYRQASGASSI